MDILNFIGFILQPNVLSFIIAISIVIVVIKFFLKYIIKYGIYILCIMIFFGFLFQMSQDNQVKEDKVTKEDVVEKVNSMKEYVLRILSSLKSNLQVTLKPDIQQDGDTTKPLSITTNPLNVDTEEAVCNTTLGPLQTPLFYVTNIENIKRLMLQGLDKVVPTYIPASIIQVCYNGCMFTPKEGMRNITVVPKGDNMFSLNIDIWETNKSCDP